MQPETRYARSGDVRMAFQVVGNGPFDIVFIPGFISNLEIAWESPARARFFSRLSSSVDLFCLTSAALASPTELAVWRPWRKGWTMSAQ